jgi:hypothetical protein
MGKKYITKTLYKMHVQKICTKFTITVYLITIIIVNPLKMVLNFQTNQSNCKYRQLT